MLSLQNNSTTSLMHPWFARPIPDTRPHREHHEFLAVSDESAASTTSTEECSSAEIENSDFIPEIGVNSTKSSKEINVMVETPRNDICNDDGNSVEGFKGGMTNRIEGDDRTKTETEKMSERNKKHIANCSSKFATKRYAVKSR